MMTFEQRMQLAKCFEEYAQKYGITTDAMGCVTYLYSFGLLDEGKCEAFLAAKTSNVIDDESNSMKEENQYV